jgi:ribosomal protein L11 methyltransferase
MTEPTETGFWVELMVCCAPEAVEIVAAILADYGLNQGVVIEAPFTQVPDGDDVQIDPTQPVDVRIFLDAERGDAAVEAVEEAVGDALAPLRQEYSISRLYVRTLKVHKWEDEDWAEAWLRYSSKFRTGNRVVVTAPWFTAYEPAPEEIVVSLETGLAFGSGAHGATELAIVALEHLVRPGDRVLDVGTGTGILALVAAHLGASAVDAVDIDPIAVRVARQNVARNGLGDVIRVELGSLGPGQPFSGTYDVVVANNMARILIELAAGMTGAVRAGGTLILSGIADFREAQVREAFETLGWRIVQREQNTWVMLVLRQPEDGTGRGSLDLPLSS